MTGPEFALGAAALPLGVLAGLAHFRVLHIGTTALLQDGAVVLPLVLTLLRLVATGSLLAALACAGAGPLLGATFGIALARALILRCREPRA